MMHIGLCLAATWAKGRDRVELPEDLEAGPLGLDLWMARAAERAKLDFVFKPDSLTLHPAMRRGGQGLVGLDPTLALTAIARETRRIGLVTTASTTFNPPYVVARQLQSLHWISQGRAGWNIVTSIEGADNFGDAPMPDAETRYGKAAEFVAVARALWASCPPAAQGEARPIDHAGAFFSVKGPLNVPAHPAGEIPLFQAGASDRGRDFAASVADAIFAAMPDIGAGIELRGDLRRRAVAQGRPAGSVRVLPGLYFFLARTRAEAEALHRQAHAHLGRGQRLEAVRAILGLGLAALAPDARVTAALLPDPARPVRSRTHADLLRRFITQAEPTVEDLLARPEVVGSAHWVVLGTVEEALEEIAGCFAAGAMDGFIALPGGSLDSLRLFLDELVPALVERGLFRRDYGGTTLREHLGIGSG